MSNNFYSLISSIYQNMRENFEETNRNISIKHKRDETVSQNQIYASSARGKKSKMFFRSLEQSMYEQRKKNILKQNKDRSSHKKSLKEIISKHKIQILKKNFIHKMRLNSENRQPAEGVETETDKENQKRCFVGLKEKLTEKKGISMGSTALSVWSFLNILHILTMIFIFSIMLSFPEITKSQVFHKIRVGSIFLFVIDIILNFIVERFQEGKLLKNLKQIGQFYIKNDFFIDLFSILIYAIDLAFEANIAILLTGISIVKFFVNKKQLEKFEYIYIDSSQREQYYGLVKVFLMNFAIGHILSVILNLMAGISQGGNWYMKIGISNADWFTKYIWGYYWGTNIMLTVGFGDLAASNTYEAIILIFIETFSCITLAYNISYVGALLGSIREREEEKKKKLKFFHKMCKENQIPQELESKITNFIEESYEIKDSFSYDEYDAVLDSLPKSIQLQYQKEANKIVFDSLGFLSNLSQKSLLKMAELVERRICHPDEVIFKKGSKPEFVILQKGCLGFACKIQKGTSNLDGKIIEELEVSKDDKPKMIGLDFIKEKPLVYDIKSDGYSIIHTLSLEGFKESLKSSDMDYQLYCVLRDREQYILDEQNIHLCPICKDKYHSKFECSRLHYKPLKQMVIYNHLYKTRTKKNKRSSHIRMRKNKLKPLRYLHYLSNEQDRLLHNYLGEEELKEIQMNYNFHQRQYTKKHQNSERKKSVAFKNQASSSHITDRIEKIINCNIADCQFWEIQCDEACNYRYYFDKQNSSRFLNEEKFKFKKNRN